MIDARRFVVLLLFCAALVATPFVAEIQNIDFNKAYYPAGKRLLNEGTILYTYGGFKNLPVVGYLFVPFAALGKPGAANAFVVAELLIYLAAFASCLRFLSKSEREDWLWLVLFLSSRHFYTCLRFGQLTLLCFLLLVWMVVAYERSKPYATGVLHALAFVIKIPLGLFFLYFAYRREFRIVATSVVTCLAILCVSLLVLGVGLHREYAGVAILDNLGATVTAHNNASIAGAAMRFLRPDPLFDWYMVPVPLPLELAIAAGVGLLFLTFTRITSSAVPRSAVARRLEISMVVCLCLTALPIVWDHYYVFLILPFHCSFEALRHSEQRSGIASWIAAFALVNLPVLAILRFLPDAVPPLLLAAIPAAPLLGCLVLLALLMAQYRSTVAISEARPAGGA